jgi:hypothetical protein
MSLVINTALMVVHGEQLGQRFQSVRCGALIRRDVCTGTPRRQEIISVPKLSV